MGLRINTNIPSLKAQRQLEKSTRESQKSLQRLSSGERIADAADDPVGLSIGKNLEAQIRGLSQARRNTNDGISMVQTAEGALNEVSNILVRLRELSVQAASDTVGETERGFINTEFQTLKQEIDRIANTTTFNGTQLLNGEGNEELDFQVGIQNTDNDRVTYNASETNVTTDNIDIDGAEVAEKDAALDSLEKLDEALNSVSGQRAKLGATQNRLQSTSNALGVALESFSTAKSRVIDTDIAKESANLTKQQILQSAGISVLAQANQSQSQALKLL